MKKIRKSSREYSPIDLEKEAHSEQYSQVLPFQELSQIKSQLFEDFSEEHYANDPIKDLYLLQQTINHKMTQLDQLNVQFYEKQEKLFFKTFINMMDRMSNQLLEFKEKYDNIDQEIDQEKECVELRNKMKFFKDQCLFLNTELYRSEKELTQLKMINLGKEIANRDLTKQLLRQCTKEEKYRSRKFSLEMRINSFDAQPLTQRRSKTNKSIFSQTNAVQRFYEQNSQKISQNHRPQTARPQSHELQSQIDNKTHNNTMQLKSGPYKLSTTTKNKQIGQFGIDLTTMEPPRKGRTLRQKRKYY